MFKVTDNRSYFIKSFKEFGVDIQLEDDLHDEVDIVSLEEAKNISDFVRLTTDDDESDEETQISTKILTLPGHKRCSSHIPCSQSYKFYDQFKGHRIEKVNGIVGHTFNYPCITRCNYFHESHSHTTSEQNNLYQIWKALELKDKFKKQKL